MTMYGHNHHLQHPGGGPPPHTNVDHHYREEPPYLPPPPPPPLHVFGRCQGIPVCLSFNEMHTYGYNFHHATCTCCNQVVDPDHHHPCNVPPYPPPLLPPHVELYPHRPPHAFAPAYYYHLTPPTQPMRYVSNESSHHIPPIINHHHTYHQKTLEKYMENKPMVRVYTKGNTNYSLTIREGQLILAPFDPSDPYQHWIKEDKFGINIKDEQGYPSFALINKATGQSLKHAIGATYLVQLTKYNPDKVDESVLWTEGKDEGDGYTAIRMVNNIQLNVDAYKGVKEYGGVRDGTHIVLWEWNEGANQMWKIDPF